jgi:hypothetical protein
MEALMAVVVNEGFNLSALIIRSKQCYTQRMSASRPSRKNVHYAALVTTDFYVAVYATRDQNGGGLLCKSPAVRGWKVCRMHGAGSREAEELRAMVSALIRFS